MMERTGAAAAVALPPGLRAVVDNSEARKAVVAGRTESYSLPKNSNSVLLVDSFVELACEYRDEPFGAVTSCAGWSCCCCCCCLRTCGRRSKERIVFFSFCFFFF